MDAPLDRPETLRRLYAALWHHAAGRRHVLLLALGLLLCSQLVMLGGPWLAGQGIDAIQRLGADGLGEAGRWLALLFLATLASWALHGPGRILERNVALTVRERLADGLMSRLFAAPLAWHQRHHSGETLHRVQQSTGALYDFAQSQFIYLQNSVRLIGPVVALALISPWVGAAAVLGYGLLGAVIIAFDRRMMRIATAENAADRRYTAALSDALGHVFSITALRRGQGVAALVAARLRASFAPLRRGIVLNEAKWASVDLASTALWCALVALYALGSDRGDTLALGKVFMVYEYARQAGGVLTALAAHFQSLARQQANLAAAQPIEAAPRTAVDDRARASDWRNLTLVALGHGHTPDRPVLQGLGLRLARGRSYALVGPSGAGKTTLLRVLAGLDVPSAGQLLLDEAGVAAMAERLRREATLIPQQAEVFEASIRDNLWLGAPPDPAAQARALETCELAALVSREAGGDEAILAEGGANWSGGQRQRLALARGVLAAEGSALVLLDEPTSSLDPATEARVMAALLQHFAAACVVCSVHRPSLLPLFDEVILMGEGSIRDMGPLAELAGRHADLAALIAPATAAR